MRTKIKNAKEKVTLACNATKDFFWFLKEIHKMEIRMKHAFIAYSAIIFISGALISDFYNYSFKQDWIQIFSSFFKAIQ